MESAAGPADRFVPVRGLRLHYLEWESAPENPPLLFLHGLHDTAHSWDFHAPALARSFRVLALDQRGHGDSDWAPGGAYETSEYVEDLAAFNAGLDLSELTLVAHSTSATASLAYAAAYPERIAKLVAVEAITDLGLLSQVAGDPPAFHSPDEVVRWLRAREPGAPMEVLWHHARFLIRNERGRLHLRHDPAVTSALTLPPIWEQLAQLTAPTLLVRGEQSMLLRKETFRRLEQAIAQSQGVEVPGAGHWPQDENPLEFGRAVRRFLNA